MQLVRIWLCNFKRFPEFYIINNSNKFVKKNIMKSKEWIEQQVCKIMYNDGPDKHTDGSDVISDFIEALIKGKEDEWVNIYKLKCEEKERQYQKWLKSNK
jgi:hypothetical protein